MRPLFKLSLLAGLMSSPLLASEPTPPKATYPYYSTSEESGYLAEILKHKRLAASGNEIADVFNLGYTTVTKKDKTVIKVHFTQAMVDFMRWLDFNNIPVNARWVYPGGAHARSGEYADPVEKDRYINYAMDIYSFNGSKVSAFNEDTTVKALVNLIDALPKGYYELGLPREAYYNDKPGKYTAADDIEKYFNKGQPDFRSDLIVGTQINEIKYAEHRLFMPYYTNETIMSGNTDLLADLAKMSAEDQAGLTKALKSIGDKRWDPDLFRYLMRDRRIGNVVADALARAKARGVLFRAMYGDALNHIHLEVLQYQFDLGTAQRITLDDVYLEPVLKTITIPRTFQNFEVPDLDKIPELSQENFEKLPDGRIRVKVKTVENGQTVWKVIYEGTPEEWKRLADEQEKKLNDRGLSSHDKGDIEHEIPTNVRALREQLLNELGMNAPGLLDKVKDPLPDSDCPRVDGSRLPATVKSRKVTLPDSTELQYGDFVERLDDTQHVLCTLGYSMLDQDLVDSINNVGSSEPETTPALTASRARSARMFTAFAAPLRSADFGSAAETVKQVVDRVMDRRDDVFKSLGLSDLTKGLNLEEFTKLGSYTDIVKDVQGYLDGTKKVGPEMINDVKRVLGVKELDDLKIPVISDFSLPGKPKRTPLNVKKTKRWDGLNMGKRDILAMEGFAELVMGGTEESETLRADAQTNFYVFGKDFNVLDGLGELSAGPEGVAVKLHATLLGMDLFKPIDETADVNLTKEMPDAFSFNHRLGYSQTFTIGPIPVAVSAGGIIDIGLGYSVAVVTTQVQGGITPHANITGYADVGVGISGFLSAGAGAEITVLRLSAPVTGGAKILFDDDGYPFLNVFIDTDVNLELLNGRVYAYVEFPIPFEIKKETMDIWKFKGPRYNHKVMSWNIAIGHQGQTTGGDILDQSDREDAAMIQQAISLDNRKETLEAYRAKLKGFADSVFQTVEDETRSVDAQKIGSLQADVQGLQTRQDGELSKFAEDLMHL